MASLADKIIHAVAVERYVFSLHARNRCEERGVSEWQVIEGTATAEVIAINEDHKPDPEVILRVLLADGSEVDCVWAWLKAEQAAILVTIYFDA